MHYNMFFLIALSTLFVHPASHADKEWAQVEADNGVTVLAIGDGASQTGTWERIFTSGHFGNPVIPPTAFEIQE